MHGLAGNLDPSAEKPPSYAELGRLPGFLSMACVLTELEVPLHDVEPALFREVDVRHDEALLADAEQPSEHRELGVERR